MSYEVFYMRELGEGIPRMFNVMEEEGLYPPEFRLDADVIFTVILRNTPVYSAETRKWLRQLESLGLSGNQKRLLAYARAHDGTFTSRAYQKLVGVDIYTASRDIKDLIRKGVARRTKKGGQVYRLATPTEKAPIPEDFAQVEPTLKRQGYLRNEDVRKALDVTREQAKRLLQQWTTLGLLKPVGKGRGARYIER